VPHLVSSCLLVKDRVGDIFRSIARVNEEYDELKTSISRVCKSYHHSPATATTIIGSSLSYFIKMSSTNVVNSSLADPNGDLNSYQYTVLAANDLMLARQRFFASAVQGIADVVILTTFTHLLIRALVLLPARRRSLPGWCLVIQMTSGFIYGCLAMTTYAPVGLGCNQITLTASFFMSLSSMLTTTCLLCQAYSN
jgi:hypothetical protein